MTRCLRMLVGILVALAVSAGGVMPARAENKRELLIGKIEVQVATGTATLRNQLGDILANVEEDYGRTYPLPGP